MSVRHRLFSGDQSVKSDQGRYARACLVNNYTAFTGHSLLARGSLSEVALKVKRKLKADPAARILVFSDSSGKQMDFDLHGSEKEVLRRLEIFLTPQASAATAGPGRPKLGVVTREISLLPRHWEWLSTQSGGASAALLRLIDEARKTTSGKELVTQAQERCYKFMSSIAGDLANYEEALRALYSRDKKKFKECISAWPTDVKGHAIQLAARAFGEA